MFILKGPAPGGRPAKRKNRRYGRKNALERKNIGKESLYDMGSRAGGVNR